MDLRELLSIPYLLEGEAVETESGKWLVRLAYPELPRCTAEEIPLYDLEGGVKVRCVLFDLAAAVAADNQNVSADYADSTD